MLELRACLFGVWHIDGSQERAKISHPMLVRELESLLEVDPLEKVAYQGTPNCQKYCLFSAGVPLL